MRGAMRALALLALAGALASTAGCLADETAGEGPYVVIVRNGSGSSVDLVVRVRHSTENLIPGPNDPGVEGDLRIPAGASGAFFFDVPAEARAITADVVRGQSAVSRSFPVDQLAGCPVIVFETLVKASEYRGCGPASS